MVPSKKHSLKRRLTLLMALASGTALLVSTVAFVANDVVMMRRSKARQLKAMADLLASNGAAALSFNMPQSATELLASLENRPTIESACFFDAEGKLFAVYQRDGKSDFSPEPPTWEGHRFRPGGYLDVALPVLEEGRAIGTIYVHASMRDVQEQLYRYAWIALGVMVLSLGLAVVLSARLQRVISTPIVDLAAAAERITAAGDYSIRVQPRSSDEIGNLYHQFNLMLQRIQTGEEELHRLTAILEATSDLVGTSTPDARVTYLNRAGRRLLGIGDDEELAGTTISDLHPEWAFRIIESEGIPAAVARGTWQGETAVLGPGDAEVPVSQVIMSHESPEGECEYLSTVMRDISERKRSEESLMQEKKVSDNIIESLPGIFYMFDERGRFVRWNKKLETVSGYSAEETAQMRPTEFFEGEDKTLIAGRIEKVFAEGQSEVEAFLVTNRGARIPYYLTGLRMTVDGKVHLVGLGVDITDRKRAEEETQRLRLLLKNMIDSMPSFLVAVDAQGRVTHWNRQAEHAMGLLPEEAEGQPLEKVFPTLEARLEQVRAATHRRQATSVEKIADYADGQEHFSDVMVYPLVSNGIEGAVIRVDDVTERVRLEEMMIQSEKMMAVGGLAAGMAHEINNPLSGILQNIQVAQDRTTGDLPANRQAAAECGTTLEAIRAYLGRRKVDQMLEAVKASGRRAAKTVQNMLSFSRKSDADVTFHDPGQLLDQTLELAASDYDLKKKYDFRQIDVVRQYAPDVPKVPCEGTKIQQVLLNLLKNGAQAMAGQKDRCEPPRLILRTGREGDMVRIEVEDNGPGMDEATRRRVFEPFFTTKEVGAGTGLGLSVSYFIITENHRGTMAVESAAGQGTKFVVRLPLKRST